MINLKQNVIYHDWNTNGRDFIVGDIHGCYDEFTHFLTLINFDKTKDIMYSVGDLIDRGTKSLECLELIYEKWFFAVRANHEDMMIKSVLYNNHIQWNNWIYNGGIWYYNHDKESFKNIAIDTELKMPYIRVIGKNSDKRVNIVHAELHTDVYTNELFTDEDIDDWRMENQEDNLVWGRAIASNKVLYRSSKLYNNDGLSITYCGHTPCETPYQALNHRFIDTGSVYAVTKQMDRVMTIVDMQDEIIYTMNMKSKELKSFKWN